MTRTHADRIEAAVRRLVAKVPLDRPFTATEARAGGALARDLREWTRWGLLVHPMRGIYYSTQLSDCLELRIACLKLVVPRECVVTDRTAAWLWGARTALAPNDHLTVPRVHVFCPPGYRLRNGLTASGERSLASSDVLEVSGLRVTSPLRTACDLGRLLHRDQAFAAMDALAALQMFSLDELLVETRRFKGYRGVVQLRALGPFVDPGSASPGESILRLRWLDVGLPRPECQLEVPAPNGSHFLLDLGLRSRKLAAEYDGAAFHTEETREHDEGRRDWLRGAGGWIIVVARAEDIHGPTQNIDQMLRQANRAALLRPGNN